MKAHRFGGLELSICIVVIPYVWNIFKLLNMFLMNFGILTTQVFVLIVGMP